MARRWWVLLALVLVSTVLVYVPAIDGEFVFDDLTILIDPLVVNPLAAKPSQWLLAVRPVTSLTFALNQLAGGLDTRGWHLVNVAIHLGAVVLAFLFARAILARAGLSRPEGPALAAAALFALHPLQTESSPTSSSARSRSRRCCSSPASSCSWHAIAPPSPSGATRCSPERLRRMRWGWARRPSSRHYPPPGS